MTAFVPANPKKYEQDNSRTRADRYETMNADRIDAPYKILLGTQLQDVFSKLQYLVAQFDGGAFGPGGPQYGLTYISTFFRDMMPESVFSHASPTGLAVPTAPPPPMTADQEEATGWKVYSYDDAQSFSNTYNQTNKLVPGWRMAVAVQAAQRVLEERTNKKTSNVLWPYAVRVMDSLELANVTKAPYGIVDNIASQHNRNMAAYLATPLGFAILFARLTQGLLSSDTDVMNKINSLAKFVLVKEQTQKALADVVKAFENDVYVTTRFTKLYDIRSTIRQLMAANESITNALSSIPIANKLFAETKTTSENFNNESHGYEAHSTDDVQRVKYREAERKANYAQAEFDAFVGTLVYGTDLDLGPFAAMYQFYKINEPRQLLPVALFGNEFCDDVLVALAVGYSADAIIAAVQEAYEDIVASTVTGEFINNPWELVPGSAARPFVWAVLADAMAVRPSVTEETMEVAKNYTSVLRPQPTQEPWITYMHDTRNNLPRVRLHCPLPFIGGSSAGEIAGALPPWNYAIEAMLGKDNKLFATSPGSTKLFEYLRALGWKDKIRTWVNYLLNTYQDTWHIESARTNVDSIFPYDTLGHRCLARIDDSVYVARTTGKDTVVPQYERATRPNSFTISINGSVRMWNSNNTQAWGFTAPDKVWRGSEAHKLLADTNEAEYVYTHDKTNTGTLMWWLPPILFHKTASQSVYGDAIFAAPCRDDVIRWRRVSSYLLRVIDSSKMVSTMLQARSLVEQDSGVSDISVWELASSGDDIAVYFARLVSALIASEISSTTVRGKADPVGAQMHARFVFDVRSRLQYIARDLVYPDEEYDETRKEETRLVLTVPMNRQGGTCMPPTTTPRYQTYPPLPAQFVDDRRGLKRSMAYVGSGVEWPSPAAKRQYGNGRRIFM